MPVKRRAEKSRKQLGSTDIEDLFYGPGTCLFNGAGYLGPHGDHPWQDKSKDVKRAVLTAMRDDWERHYSVVLAAWEQRTPHDLYIAREHHQDPSQPWALRRFGKPWERGNAD
jgi:hypothetical protein